MFQSKMWRASVLIVLVALAIWSPIQMAASVSATVPLLHQDGAYQTFNGLLRLSDGQLPGRDFFPYLGAGPLFLLFPLYALLGSTITSSVFTATFVTAIAMEVVFALLAVMVFRRRSWLLAVTAALVPVILVHFFQDNLINGTRFNLDAIFELSIPGNSLRPIRAFAPYLLALLVLLTTALPIRRRWRALILGTTAGVVAAIWSNDYALISALLLLLVVSLRALMPERWRVGDILMLWLSSGAAFLLAGFAATAGHFIPYLKYNLIDVRGDQYWYFGAWDSASRINSLHDLIWCFRNEYVVWALAVLALVTLVAAIRRELFSGLLAYLGWSLFLGGLAATVGGHVGLYFLPLRLWAVVVVGMVVVRLVGFVIVWMATALTRRWEGFGDTIRTIAAVLTVVAVAVASLAVAVQTTRARQSQADQLRADPAYVYDDQLGGYLDVRFIQHLSQTPDVPTDLLEEYAGLMTARLGSRPDVPVDSVIHALGRQRAVYAEALARRPEMVVTSAIGVSNGLWTGWNVSANWWFYKDLFRSYLPDQTSPTTIVWELAQKDSPPWPVVPCEVRGQGVQIHPTRPGLYEVNLDYTGPGVGSRTFSKIRNGVNGAAWADGFVALDPGATQQAVPVYATDSTSITLDMEDVGPDLGHPATEITSCTARRVLTPSGSLAEPIYAPLFTVAETPENITDVNWTHGVGNAFAGLVIVRTPPNLLAVENLRSVSFSDGTTRKVARVEPADGYINIYLKGQPLDPDVAGYPNLFTMNK